MKSFTKLVFVTALMTATMSIAAQNHNGFVQLQKQKSAPNSFKYYEVPGVKSTCSPVTPDGYEKVTKNGVTTLFENKRKAVQKGGTKPPVDESGIAVKCVFDCNMEDWTPSQVIAFNKTNDAAEYYDWENNFVTMNLEAGTYDFIAIYTKVDQTSIFYSSYQAWVIKEGVEISEETTLNFDPNTATNHISMRSYNPNGEATRLRRVKYIDEEWNYEILEEYNVYDVYMEKTIYHEDYGIPYSESTNLAGVQVELNPDLPQMGQWKAEEWSGDIYVNDVSDKYMFQQFRIMPVENEVYSTIIRTKGGKTQTATNDYTKYYNNPIQFKYKNSPAREKYNAVFENGDYGMAYFCTYKNECPWIMYGFNSKSNAIHNIRFCPSSTVTEYDNLIAAGFSFNYVDACLNFTEEYDGEIYTYQTTSEVSSQYIFPQANGNEWRYAANQTWLDTSKDGDPRYATGAEGLNFDYSNTNLVAGSTCPIAISMYYDYPMWDGGTMPVISTVYKGQMGELRTSDDIDATIELKANDEVIATSTEELNEWMYSEEPHTPAKLTLSMTNRNFKVDGIDGFNDMVCVVDQTKDDSNTPSLTALQFHAAEGFVTNCFEKTSDGTIALMCGDFNQQLGNDGRSFWFEYGNCELTVEYAPNGTEDFATIEMTKDDSKFYTPGYGAYYSASLSSVIAESANNWYDVRITVKDATGNYQQQTISPAFRIGNAPTSINDLNNSNAVEVARYTIDGRVISAPQAGINIVKMSDGTSRKELVR